MNTALNILAWIGVSIAAILALTAAWAMRFELFFITIGIGIIAFLLWSVNWVLT